MPINLQPGRTFKIVLSTDSAAPDPKPAFIFRYLSCAEFIELADLHDKLLECTDTAAAIGAMVDTVKFAMVGWENMGRDFDPAAIPQILTLGEAKELSGLVLRKQRLDEGDRGNSPSPSPSVSDKSAETAAAAPAETSPAS